MSTPVTFPLVQSMDGVAALVTADRSAAIATAGGKATRLAWLRSVSRPGFPVVPDGFVVTAHAYRQVVTANGLRALVRSMERSATAEATPEPDGRFAALAAELRSAVSASRLPPEVIEGMAQQIARLRGAVGTAGDPNSAASAQQGRLAARSSAVDEDGRRASFAGLHDSFLPVDPGDLEHRVLACMASLFSDRALGYRSARRLPLDGAAMAVLVHPMLDADVGGVVFSRDPDGNSGDVVIEWAGSGPESVVAGRATPRRVVVRRPAPPWSPPPVAEPDDVTQHRVPWLDEQARLELARFATWADTALGGAVDIEWLRSGGRTAVVQIRPLLARDVSKPVTDASIHVPGAGDIGVGNAGSGNAGPTAPEIGELGDVAGALPGTGIGRGRVEGVVWRPSGPGDLSGMPDDAVLVVEHTDPSWLPAMQLAAAVVTIEGGQTSHAAIVSRELGLLAVIGCAGAGSLVSGTRIIVQCEDGRGSVRLASRVDDR